MALSLRVDLLAGEYAVCRLAGEAPVPGWAVGELVSVTRSASELSVVCPAGVVPSEVQAERGWRSFRVAGPLAFSETGIVAGLTAPLAAAGVPVFVVSTFDTDYVLVPGSRIVEAVATLRDQGCELDGDSEDGGANRPGS